MSYNSTQSYQSHAASHRPVAYNPMAAMNAPAGTFLPGTKVQITFNLPADPGSGRTQTVMVGGMPVRVAFDKIGDVP